MKRATENDGAECSSVCGKRLKMENDCKDEDALSKSSHLISEFLAFVEKWKSYPVVYVELEDLLALVQTCSPKKLTYKDSDKRRHLSEAIVMNFCATNAKQQFFRKKGLEALASILNSDGEDGIAKRTLFLHLTKMTCSIENMSLYFISSTQFKISRDLDHDEKAWLNLAHMVIKHVEINSVIDDNIRKYQITPVPVNNATVTFVSNLPVAFRGFCGQDKIFVNRDHFRKFETKTTNAQYVTALEMYVISLLIHGLSHIKLRKAYDDFNLSTPNLARQCGLSDAHHKEFGRFNEESFFLHQVDWLGTAEANVIDLVYATEFKEALRNNKILPRPAQSAAFFTREPSQSMGGLDIASTSYFE